MSIPVKKSFVETDPFSGSPFDLRQDEAYARWRAAKLSRCAKSADELIVEIGDPGQLTDAEVQAITNNCRRSNMAIYRCRQGGGGEAGVRAALPKLSRSLGLVARESHRSADADGMVALRVSHDASQRGFIPYTDRPLNWHTDGYYNAAEDRVRAFVLHCVRAAASGGENGLLDPEIAYIRLRDENPDYIAALSHPEAMIIPENVEKDGSLRPASVGPVFCVDEPSGALVMRYTARSRNITWRDDSATQQALRFLTSLLDGDEPLIARHRLAAGEGIVCNNVLHCRSRFQDQQTTSPDQGRLLYRIRYPTRIAGT